MVRQIRINLINLNVPKHNLFKLIRIKFVFFLGLFILVSQSNAQITDFDNISFLKADQNALKCKNDGLDNLPRLVQKLTLSLPTEVERFRALYMWVCSNIANDYGLYERNMGKRRRFEEDSLKLHQWNQRFRKLSMRKLIEDKRTICTGYAYLLKAMSDLANINCVIVDGYARTSTIDVSNLTMPNHNWNAVQLNGKWYLCDPTWASGTPNPDTFRFEFNYNDGFFLANPELFALNHYPLLSKWFLLEEREQPTFKEFLEAPVFYGKTYSNLNAFYEPIKMHLNLKKHETISFRCLLKQDVQPHDIYLLIDNGSSTQKISPQTQISEKLLTIKYAFEHNGFYDVHLYVGDDLITTCTYRVKG